ncbi:MAG: hypothetical protein K2F87_05270 [Muribaculaceae bacterium]|nr:hypothetical protein [Muribaculaceae bacterium]
MAFLLGSCSQDTPEIVEGEETYKLSLQLTTGGIFTRADNWEADDSEFWVDGTAFDQTISSVDLFLLDEDDNLTPLYALKDEDTESASHIYVCDLKESMKGVKIDKETRKANFSGRIMAVANMDAKGNPWFDLTDWSAKKMPFDVNFGTSAGWHIPMWGVESYSNVTIEANKVKRLSDIEMIRGVSKIVIKLDESIKTRYEIKEVKMAQESQLLKGAGYNLPDDALEITSTRNLTRSSCLALRDDAAGKADPNFTYSQGNADEWFTYVSESRTEDDTTPFAFDVTLRDKQQNSKGEYPEFTGTVYLAYYSFINPAEYDKDKVITDVVRNHTYQFTLKLRELTFVPAVDVWKFGGKVHIDLE